MFSRIAIPAKVSETVWRFSSASHFLDALAGVKTLVMPSVSGVILPCAGLSAARLPKGGLRPPYLA